MPDLLDSVRGRPVLVGGAGVSGRAIALALRDELGAEVTITDGNPDRLAELSDVDGVALVPGLDAPQAGTALLVHTPSWRPAAPLLLAAAAAGVPAFGEVEFGWRLGQRRANPPVWLAVTGTNGKTTTVGMLASILAAAGENSVACGNIGLPVTDAVRAGYEVLAVELSSFQLHHSTSLAPRAAAVLNIAEDHIDWHGSMREYAAAKGRIYAHTTGGVYNADDPESARLGAEHGVTRSFTLTEPGEHQWGVRDGWLCEAGMPLAEVADVRVPGPHNLANALAAAALARIHGVPAAAVAAGLRAFGPGAHRCVELGELAGVRYVNDSKATNPHAAAGSLRAFEHIVWIAGGQLKGSSVDGLLAEVAPRLRGAVLLGVDAPVIAAALARHAPDVPVRTVPAGDDEPMITAVRSAQAMATAGDVVLLAPAAASLDMFRNYGQRGDAFADAFAALSATPVR